MPEFTGKLRPYQQEALDHFLAEDNPYKHHFLGDEMGLGKTYVGTKYAVDTYEGKPILVVAPLTGVVDSWVEHFELLTDFKVKRINTKSKKYRAQSIDSFESSEAQVFVMHPEGLRIEEERLDDFDWGLMIIDESHRIKNRKTKTFAAAKHVGRNADHRLALTGTPVMNRPDELWAQLNWLYPNKKSRLDAGMKYHFHKLLNSYWRFYKRFLEYEVDDYLGYHTVKGTRHEDELRELLDPFYMRRLKRNVLTELPSKQYQTYYVDLHPKQRRAYDDMRKSLIAWIGEKEDSPIVAPVVIAQLVRLQQFALAFGQVNDDNKMLLDEPSTKLDMLMEILEDAPDKQFVVFSTSKQMVDLAEARMKKVDIPVAKITGDIKSHLRSKVIKEFREGERRVFIATIGAGGTGLNLQNADTAIFLDRDWSPANNLQAEDRIHRIGQESESVHIIDIMAKDTIDFGKRDKLDLKWEWIRATVGG